MKAQTPVPKQTSRQRALADMKRLASNTTSMLIGYPTLEQMHDRVIFHHRWYRRVWRWLVDRNQWVNP